MKSLKETLLVLEKRWKADHFSPLKSDLSSVAFRFHTLFENLEKISWFKGFFQTASSVLNNHDLLEARFDAISDVVRNEYNASRVHEVPTRI